MINDLTIVYYTANVVPESFGNKVREHLLKAAGNIPIISVSQKPMDLGYNICVGNIGRSHINIYRQALIGVKAANTKYVAFAEDDILYHKSHFNHIPKPGHFAYDMHIWRIYTWIDPPIFSRNHRINMYELICERDLFIKVMEERFAKYPEYDKIPLKYWAEPTRYENHLGVTVRDREEYDAEIPSIAFSHETALGYLNLGKRKKLGDERVAELPYWGKASVILKLYK